MAHLARAAVPRSRSSAKVPTRARSSEGPEYETVYALGSGCGIYELDAVIAADQLCDQLGLDTISVGVTIAFAMECFEKGLLTLEDTGGLDLRFGNADAMLKLIHQAAYRTGLGARIARGAGRWPRRSAPGARPSPCTPRAWR